MPVTRSASEALREDDPSKHYDPLEWCPDMAMYLDQVWHENMKRRQNEPPLEAPLDPNVTLRKKPRLKKN